MIQAIFFNNNCEGSITEGKYGSFGRLFLQYFMLFDKLAGFTLRASEHSGG